LFDGAATSGIGLQRPALTNTDWLHWLSCYIFYAQKQLLLPSRNCNSVRPSVCLSVRPFVTRVDQSTQKRCKLGLPNFHRRLHGTIVMRSR